ncbi:hypothetical protein [Streptomyces tricolor]|uniref:hypothetical protein n=1 Tax=Streptomyces tricolor TaxID=68277 RepID=UPI003D7663B9
MRAWRESVNPSAPEVNGASFVVARVALLAMAAFGIYYGFQSISFADGQAWSDKELTSAVSGATDDLDGEVAYAGPREGVPPDFDGAYARKVEDEVAENGAAMPPRWAWKPP